VVSASVVVSSVVVSSVVVPSSAVDVEVTGGALGRAIVPVGTRAVAAGGASELPDAR
jgi:hypothetical protein